MKSVTKNIAYNLLLGFGLLILLFITVTIFSSITGSGLNKNIQKTIDHPLYVTRITSEIKVSVLLMHRTMKDIILSESPQEFDYYISLLSQEENSVKMKFDLIEKAILSPQGDELVLKAKSSFLQWESIRGSTQDDIREINEENDNWNTRSIGAKHVELIQEQLNDVIEHAFNLAVTLNQKSAGIAQNMVSSLLYILVIGSLISSTVAYYVVRKVTVKLAALDEAAHKIDNGYWDDLVNVTGSDELRMLARSIEGIVNRYNEVIDSLEEKLEKSKG
ncbi:MAG: MCP four helix bundle domain-containing protein [Candidatus Brocadiales bacterium]|nr:MCP four helix bundle domain-containing protein [Candidatus Brocadiales bacterium]